jgi:Family of unknown function (DUF5675)
MQEYTLDRSAYVVEFEGRFLCYALENRKLLIPTGVYKVILTPSGRAKAGTLWTPWDDYVLPELLAVPGRTAIRIHAANEEKQLEGCIALGTDRSDGKLLHSRDALELYKSRVRFPHWIEVK